MNKLKPPDAWPAVDAARPLNITLTLPPELAAELEQRIRTAVVEALDSQTRHPVLLTIDELGHALGCSRATVNRLRGEGLPTLSLGGESPRFELETVLAWLRARP